MEDHSCVHASVFFEDETKRETGNETGRIAHVGTVNRYIVAT